MFLSRYWLTNLVVTNSDYIVLSPIVSLSPLVLPARNLGISQEIQPKCPGVLSKIVSVGGKGTINYDICNSVEFRWHTFWKTTLFLKVNMVQVRFGIQYIATSQEIWGMTRLKQWIKRHPGWAQPFFCLMMYIPQHVYSLICCR